MITDDRRRSTVEESEAIYHDYVAKIGTFAGWLIGQNYTVRFLIGDATYDTRVRQDVRAYLERNGFDYQSGEIIDEPAASAEELLSQLRATDIVVASRFHNVLLALMLRKPVVAISFHEKVASLMSALGLADFCQDIEHVDVDRLIEQFTELKRDAANVRCQLEHRSGVYRKALERQYETIFSSR